jgi:hypothetical protein
VRRKCGENIKINHKHSFWHLARTDLRQKTGKSNSINQNLTVFNTEATTNIHSSVLKIQGT